LYVTLEPCSTHGRTPPCTEAIKAAGIRRVVIGASDPNPQHAGRAFRILRRAGMEVIRVSTIRRSRGTTDRDWALVAEDCTRLNEAFNHWIVHRTPLVTVKAAMTLDGKIATKRGESKWITGEQARSYSMTLRQANDAILVGVNTVLADNPSLTVRTQNGEIRPDKGTQLRRIILDSMARTPVEAKVVSDKFASLTTLVVSSRAPKRRLDALRKRVDVVVAPSRKSAVRNPQSAIDVSWLLKHLGGEEVTSLLVEGGGEVNASFLLGGFAGRVAFFYAPKILGGRDSRKAVAGDGVGKLEEVVNLKEVRWRKLGPDLLLTALVGEPRNTRKR
jgi:diaminohydroxyphosphoribosylaminopyrimidine deaminase/5-amino-6-(5-phosphoribosylamino)uracil reductase